MSSKKKKALRRAIPYESYTMETLGDLAKVLGGDNIHAMVLVSVSVLENAVVTLLHKVMIKDDVVEGLFDIDGDLSSSSKCIRMAYCLGLIDKDTHDALKLIARIRNLFAHSVRHLDFENKDVAELCKELQYPKGMGGVSLLGFGIPLKDEKKIPAVRFCEILIMHLLHLLAVAKHIEKMTLNESLQAKAWVEARSQMSKEIIGSHLKGLKEVKADTPIEEANLKLLITIFETLNLIAKDAKGIEGALPSPPAPIKDDVTP